MTEKTAIKTESEAQEEEVVPSAINAKVPASARLNALMGGSRVKVFLDNDHYVTFGRSTMVFVRTIRYDRFGEFHGEVLNIGNFTDISPKAHIIMHDQERCEGALNHTLGGAFIFAELFHRFREDSPSYSPITIGGNVTIGPNAIIMPGVTVGHGAVIHPGAVVNQDVPDFAIVEGNPAGVTGYRYSEEVIEKLLALRWWDWKPEAIIKQLPEMQTMPVEEWVKKHEEQTPALDQLDRYFCLKVKNTLELGRGNAGPVYDLLGIEVEGQFLSMHELPTTMSEYISQFRLEEDKPLKARYDIFERCQKELDLIHMSRVMESVG